MKEKRHIFLSMVLTVALILTCIGTEGWAQVFKIGVANRVTLRDGTTTFDVGWTDSKAANHAGYYFMVNTVGNFLIDKRNAINPPLNQPFVRTYPISLQPSTTYYFHLAPLDRRGRIGGTESMVLYKSP